MGIDEPVRALFAPKMVYSGRLLESNGLAPCHCTVDDEGVGDVNNQKRVVTGRENAILTRVVERGEGVVGKQNTAYHSHCQIV